MPDKASWNRRLGIGLLLTFGILGTAVGGLLGCLIGGFTGDNPGNSGLAVLVYALIYGMVGAFSGASPAILVGCPVGDGTAPESWLRKLRR
jgi:hypothetical protein